MPGFAADEVPTPSRLLLFFDTKANHDTYSRPLFELPIRFALSGTSVHNLASLISIIIKVPDLYMSLPCKKHVQGPPMCFSC